MTVQEVMLKAISGEVHRYPAAEILGWRVPNSVPCGGMVRFAFLKGNRKSTPLP